MDVLRLLGRAMCEDSTIWGKPSRPRVSLITDRGGDMGDGGGEGGGGGGGGRVGASYTTETSLLKFHSMRSGSWRQAAKAGG